MDQLGILYDKMNRVEESVNFHKKAADIRYQLNDLAAEGHARNNLAIRLIKLKRYTEARTEILRGIECYKPYGNAVEIWTAYAILSDLEQATGNPRAAAEAREQAMQLYLAYRRAGGENYNPGGRLCLQFHQMWQANQKQELAGLLAELANNPKLIPQIKTLIPKLQAIFAGSGNKALAADPELDYDDAAELLFLLEQLGQAG